MELHYRDLAESTWTEAEEEQDPARRAEPSADARYYAQMATYYATVAVQDEPQNMQSVIQASASGPSAL